MKQTPLKRYTPLARSPMKRGRAKRRADDNAKYKSAVKKDICIASDGTWGPCRGQTDPHHAGRNEGMGRRAGDATIVPLCRWHHEQITGLPFIGYGVFDRIGIAGRRKLQDEWIARTQAKHFFLMLVMGR